MKKTVIIAIVLFANVISIFSQDVTSGTDTWEVYTFIGSFEEESNPYLAFQKQHTDTLINPNFPVMFNLPDKNNPSEIISIDSFLTRYGDLPFIRNLEEEKDGFLQTAITSYFKSMLKKTLAEEVPPLYSDVKITYITDPNNSGSDYWVIPNSATRVSEILCKWHFPFILRNRLTYQET